MSPRKLLWIVVPVALFIGVLWLSGQDNSGGGGSSSASPPPEGIRLGELAGKIQAREKAVIQKEATLTQLEQRLNTLQITLAQEQEKAQGEMAAREKALADEKAKFEAERSREYARIRDREKVIEDNLKREMEGMKEEQARELEKIREERARIRIVSKVDEQLVRTFEAMDPIQASRALQELAKTNFEVAVGLMASMAPKRAARLLDQLVPLDVKLSGDLSERLGLRDKNAANAANGNANANAR